MLLDDQMGPPALKRTLAEARRMSLITGSDVNFRPCILGKFTLEISKFVVLLVAMKYLYSSAGTP